MIDNKKYSVVAIGNAMLDVVCEVPEQFLTQEGISKGAMNLVSMERSNNILKKDHGLNHGKLKQTEDKYVCSFDFSGVDDTTTVLNRYEVITVNRYSGDATRKYNEKRYVHKNKETVYQIELMDRYKCTRVKERKF